MKLINRDISWFSFNARVLQEADDATVPLLERLKFLGIFSSNLDEFFRVRVASLRRESLLGLHENPTEENASHLLNQIQETVLEQQHRFSKIFKELGHALEKEHIYLINDAALNEEQAKKKIQKNRIMH